MSFITRYDGEMPTRIIEQFFEIARKFTDLEKCTCAYKELSSFLIEKMVSLIRMHSSTIFFHNSEFTADAEYHSEYSIDYEKLGIDLCVAAHQFCIKHHHSGSFPRRGVYRERAGFTTGGMCGRLVLT